jgi:hypothetical protein
MLTAMTSLSAVAVTALHTLPVPTHLTSPGETDVAALLHALDATGLQLRVSQPDKVVSVYPTSPEATAAVTALARTGRQTLPQLDWTLEFSPTEIALILTGPESALAALGLADADEGQLAGA